MTSRYPAAMKKAFVILTLICGLIAAPAAFATPWTWCARNGVELETGLALGENQPDSYTIMVVQGNHDLTLAAGHQYIMSRATRILGGYTANCGSRVVDAGNTVVNLHGTDFLISELFGSPASLRIEGITFVEANGFGLYIGSQGGDVGNLELSRVQVRGSANPSGEFYLVGQNGSVTLADTVISNTPVHSASQCGVHAGSRNGTRVSLSVINSTVDLRGGKNFCFGSDSSSAGFYNSIIWSSDGTLAAIKGMGPALRFNLYNNIYRTVSGATGGLTDSSPLHADPQWVAPASGNYRLKSGSPAVDSGTAAVPLGLSTTDVEGNVRWQGGTPDRGAYESVFNNATEFTVKNTMNEGVGSLRQAIIDANNSSKAGTIKFAIAPGACPQVIKLAKVLPKITARVLIDGTTQPGSKKNTSETAFNATLCVLIKPANGTLTRGFLVDSADAGASLQLRGVGLGGFSQAVQLQGGSGHVIAGNQFGGVIGGVSLPGASINAITLGGAAAGSLIVGGSNLADRNVIGSAESAGVAVQADVESAPDKCQIVNNVIGLNPGGTSALPNFHGVILSGEGCSVRLNRIAGNRFDAIFVNDGNFNEIQENLIGFTVGGIGLQTSETGSGVRVLGSGNVIGTKHASGVVGNQIRFMATGVSVVDGNGNEVRGNSMYDNGIAGPAMDIDLGNDGPTVNDPNDLFDGGPNGLQNHPVIDLLYYPAGDATEMNAAAHLNSKVGDYRIEAYHSARCDNDRGHAERYVGTKLVTIAADSNDVGFDLPLVLPTQTKTGFISLTATNASDSTSELGNCLPVNGAMQGADFIFADGFEQ